jgi:Kef-type K+ transport system membrane component KefB
MNILTLIGITVVAAYYMGHAAKKVRLPSLIGYMLLGVVFGSSVLGYFNGEIIEHLGFINEIALGFVAFSIGIELSMSSLKRLGSGIISIIFVESFAAILVVRGAV